MSNVPTQTDRRTRSSSNPDDLAKFFRDLEIDDDYDSNWQGLPVLDNLKGERRERIVKQVKDEMSRLNQVSKDIDDDYLKSLELEGYTDVKGYGASKFEKHKGKRRNLKEQRRFEAKQRVKRRNAHFAKVNAKNVPHSDETSIPTEVDVNVDERNDFVRLAFDAGTEYFETRDQDLNDLLSSISVPEGLCSKDESIVWLSYLENLVILGYQIGKATSFTDVFVAIIGYIKMHHRGSVVKEIVQLIDKMTKECPKEEVIPEAWEAQDILQKWHLFKTNTVFTKVSFLMSAAMSMSVCSVKEIKWHPLGLELISLEAAKQQLKAVDVIDALISTFSWMAETGYRVFQEKSLMPLLYSDQKMQKFNEDCDFVCAHAEAILAGNGQDVQDFEAKVDDVLKQITTLKKVKDNGPTAIWLQQRFAQLVDIKYKITAKHLNTAIRFAPFGVGLTGPSGVGKSTLGKLVMKTVLHAMGFEPDPKRIITMDMFDKYDSTYTSDILGVFIDDVGNGKSAFAVTSPTDLIIKFFNNMAAQAVKAELNSKGVVFVNFKCGVITSNLEDYDAPIYSNKPEATLRRLVHTRVRIKSKYRKIGSVSLNTDHPELNEETADLCHDVWELDLEECHIFETREGEETYKFKIMNVTLPDGRYIKCKNLDLKTYLQVLVVLAKKHAVKQQKVIDRSHDFDSMKMCDECCIPKPLCSCKLDPHAYEFLGEVIHDTVASSIRNYVNTWLRPFSILNTVCGYKPIRTMATKELSFELQQVMNKTVTPFVVTVTPSWLFQTSVFQKTIDMWQRKAALYDIRRPMKLGFYFFLLPLLFSLCRQYKSGFLVTLVCLWFYYMTLWSQYRARVRLYKEEYLRRRDALPEYAKEMRDGYVIKSSIAVASIVVGLKLFQLWNKARLAKMEPNSGLLSPDKIDGNPGWFGFMMSKLGAKITVSEASKRAIPSQVVATVEKNNLFWAEFHRPDGTMTRCNIFFPRKSVAWFPEHVFYPNSDMSSKPVSDMVIHVYRHNQPGGKFSFRCEYSGVVRSQEHDLVCAYVPNCPDLKDKLKWLPLTRPYGSSLATFVVRREGAINRERISVQHGHYGHKYRNFYGGSYCSEHAKVGACMGVIVLEQKDPAIVGFHIGGKPSDNYGVMQTITRQQADSMILELEAMPGVLLSSLSNDIPETQFGRKVLESHNVHPHCMAAHLPADAFIDVVGSTKLRMMQTSRVKKSILSDHVEEVMGVANKWGPPKLIPNWKGYNATLEHIVNPADMFLPSKLERARLDWLKPLRGKMIEYRKVEDIRPLTLKESILGIPGKRFLDPLKMDTGMGFPVFGPKNKFFEEIRDGESLIDRIPSQEVMEEIDRMMRCWKDGLRAYPVTSATLKDEATSVESEKVRVFQAAPVAMSLLIRKYFLPIARFLSLHPLISECAVGINAFSPEWQELMDYVLKFAPDKKVAAWDYKKFDVRMSSQVTKAVWLSFIDLAELAGYSADELYVMKMMVNDIVHPVMDYNGTLIVAYNMNTSGNNLTVNVNSTAGSFYARLGFFDVYPEVEDFREYVAAGTYGDDFIGSVRDDKREFNFVSFQQFLAKHKITITLPDKSSDLVDFLDVDDADFLKRKSHYIPEIETAIGKLDENSIFKSLHANVESNSVSQISVAVSCIETAMHEWFAYGREHYEMRANQMRDICKKLQLPVPAVNVTFDERVEHWLSKYKN